MWVAQQCVMFVLHVQIVHIIKGEKSEMRFNLKHMVTRCHHCVCVCECARKILMTMQKSTLLHIFSRNFHLTMNWQCLSHKVIGVRWWQKISVIAKDWFDFSGALAHRAIIIVLISIRSSILHLLDCRHRHRRHRLCYRCHYRNTNDVNLLFMLHFFSLASSSFVWYVFRCHVSIQIFSKCEQKKWIEIDKTMWHFNFALDQH